MCDALGGDGDLRCLGDGPAPSEGSVAIEEHTGKIGWIQISEAFDDDVAGLSFVSIAADFLRRQLAGDGDVAVAVIGAASAPCRWLIMGYLIAGLVFV